MVARSYTEALDNAPEARGMVPVAPEPEWEPEPDYEAIAEARAERRGRYFADRDEWGGLDRP